MHGSTPGTGLAATIAALWLALALPTGASAKDVVTNETLHYVTDTVQIAPDSTGGGLVSACPKGTYPISGGFQTNVDPSQDEFAITTSAPTDALDGWFVAYRSDVAFTRNFTVRAVCAQELPKLFEKSKEIRSHEREGISVNCPRRRHVYGGGAVGDPDVSLASSFPIDSDDRGKKPDDGWKVSMDNDQPSGKAEIFVIAACGKAEIDYNGFTVPLDPSVVSNPGIGCDASLAAIAGGQKIGGRWGQTTVYQSIVSNPTDFNAYEVTAENTSAHQLPITTYAICGDPGAFG